MQTKGRVIRLGIAAAAAALIALSTALPLWSMKMEAPQYRHGLFLRVYGTGMTGDIPELNILNHYIGMPPIEAPQLETRLFPIGVAFLIGLALTAPLHRWIRRTAVAATAATPLAILADLQWRLYSFGHSLNPTAPIRLKPFTPLVFGETEMGNFESHGMVSTGFFCLIAAALLLILLGRLNASVDRRRSHGHAGRRAAIAAALTLLLTSSGRALAAQPGDLQRRIDAAPRGSTIVVPAGRYGSIVVRGPLVLIGEPGATIDGGGTGSVVTIAGEAVVFRGFAVRNSGRDVTEEAAGITVTGGGHRIESNDIRDVYFGVHLENASHLSIIANRIVPGTHHGARPGHGINAWYVKDSEISGNGIAEGRDGVYLSFTERVAVVGNTITKCRYGVHSMYSHDARIDGNIVEANLLGAALMMSDRLVLTRNHIRNHRDGAAAYGVLLKDIGQLTAEDNQIVSNRVGIYAESVSTDDGREASFARNLIAGNEVGLALQSTAALTVTGNRIAENLTDVRPLGRQLSAGMRWSRDDRGNSWSAYHGYDANGDGVGDQPHRVDATMEAILQRNPLIQAFLYTPAHLAVEAAARMFPLYRPAPILVDSRPLMKTTAIGAVR